MASVIKYLIPLPSISILFLPSFHRFLGFRVFLPILLLLLMLMHFPLAVEAIEKKSSADDSPRSRGAPENSS